MSEILQAIILGIVQGLTEFLPVSSSGHLEIVKVIVNDQSVGEQSLLMTVVLHFATALSTVVVFRKDIAEIFKGLFQFKNNESFAFSVKIILSMIPAALVGVLFNDQIEAMFDRNLLLVGVALIFTALLLYLADRINDTTKSVGYKEAIIIGIAQAIAITPGISRSGATISTSLLLNIDREKAARFSFLMVVPLIFGKMAKDLMDGSVNWSEASLIPLGAGFIAAFITGLVACVWMIQLVKRAKLTWFALYCLVVGLIAIAYQSGAFN
jgi:undecaprenyl-diphosphatase